MSYILLIGAKSDIAKCLARKYAQNGFDLYLAARNAAELARFANDIVIRTGKHAQCIEFDITDFDSHDSFYSNLKEKPVGVIIAAGYLGNQRKAETNFIETKKIIDTNFTGAISILNVIVNDFESRRSGFIVGISSVAGDRGRKGNYIYGSAKAAFTTYLSGLRNRHYSSNISVLTVKPGFVATKMTKGMDLPAWLTAHPEKIAEVIFRAQKSKKNILYSMWIWRWIMLVILCIPERIFKKLNI